MTASLRRNRAKELEKARQIAYVKESEKEVEENKSSTEDESSNEASSEDGSKESADDGSKDSSGNGSDSSTGDDSGGDGESNDGDSSSEENDLEDKGKEPSSVLVVRGASTSGVARVIHPSSSINDSLLKSINTHISYGIWNKHEERGPLKCISHWRKLQEWSLKDMPSVVVEKIKNSGLFNLVQHTYKHVDYVTISAFVERWHPETNSFHMPFGEMTITLDDVAQILKIPVVGTCVYKKDDRSGKQLLMEYLEITSAEAREQTNDSLSAKLHFLLDKFGERANEDDANEHDYENVTRAYILYLLGCSIFCDKSGTKVSLNYLKCLDNVNQLGEYAWGMGVLAYLYRQLGLASRRDVRQMSGYLTLLTAWIYDHFPMLPNAVPNKNYDVSLPRMCRRQPIKQSGDATSAIIRLREQLDGLNAQDVCWDPYRDVRSHYPLPDVAFFSGVLLCFDIAEPYYPQRVLRQFGICQRIPSKPMEPKKCRRGLNANQYKISYDNCFWYAENWEDHVLSSKSRLPLAVDSWDCTAKYMEWYMKESHPIVQHPDLRQSRSRKVDVAERLRIAAGTAVEMLKQNLNAPPPKRVAKLLQIDRAAVEVLEEALNDPDKREKRKKSMHDSRN